ncbi:hypothetical protein niasHT_010850 [Heterodera trifolii]|uniref:Uncharacterized protein n=1 Tax=Heterodera trifolii TaxID=157864 RepID=A0ABD2LCY0_9BILA
MKNIILLIAFFGCFRSAFQVKCRWETVGTMEKPFVHKKATNYTLECHRQEKKACEAVVCFNERVPGYFTHYGCGHFHANYSDVCNKFFEKYFSLHECELIEPSKNYDACDKELNKAEKAFELKYGGYKCQDCFFGKEKDDLSNMAYPEYKPTSKPAKNASASPKPQKGIGYILLN